MPSYEFRCQNCGHHFTVFNVAWEKKSLLTCPECGSDKLREVFGFNYRSGGATGTSGRGCGGGFG